jgi:acetyl esterase/lipase
METRTRVGVAAAVVLCLAVVAGCGGGADTTRGAGARGADAAPATSTVVATRPPGSERCPAVMPPVRDVPYAGASTADPALQDLDVHPAGRSCPTPVVVWVHGGGWQRGDKRNQIRDKVLLWNRAGYTVVSVNHRLSGPRAAAPVQYPAHDADVAAAVAWVHDHIARYGGDPDRISLLGHSAGAQIVASVATAPAFLAAHGPGLDALRCAGALDTEGYDVTGSAATGNPIYRAAFGDDPATWSDASPIEHVSAGTGIPRFLVVERGTARRRRGAEAFVARLRGAGVAVTVVDAGPLTHAQVNSQIGRPGDSIVTPPLEVFLADCFGATS